VPLPEPDAGSKPPPPPTEQGGIVCALAVSVNASAADVAIKARRVLVKDFIKINS
jgi:hypothetical protein